jgi:hypothetical protein
MINGNKKDLRLENLEVLCYNCYFVNVGNLGKVELRADVHEAPDAPEALLENEDSLDALSTMDILSEEEKLQMIKDLKDSF